MITRHHPKSNSSTDAKVMMDMNMTPMIDVLLVLIILFIITVPIQTHAVKIDLPTGLGSAEMRDTNRIQIDVERRLYWNGRQIDQFGLRGLLVQAGAMEIQPVIEFAPDPQAPFDTVDQVMADIKVAGIQTMGFVGNEQHADFAAAYRPAQLTQ